MANARRWFRVELTASGDLISCRQVDVARTDTARVFYVAAESSEKAQRAVFDAYHRKIQQERRARLTSEGKCPWCGCKADRGRGLRCKVCNKHNEESARANARKRGEQLELVPRVASRAGGRYLVLVEVQQAWREAENNASFTRWLEREIAAAKARLPEQKRTGTHG